MGLGLVTQTKDETSHGCISNQDLATLLFGQYLDIHTVDSAMGQGLITNMVTKDGGSREMQY